MPMTRKLIALIGITLAVASASSDAFAQRVSKRTAGTATRDVRNLLKMMDADQNGVVSKDEFMNFMSRTFDRLDVNKSGALEPNEMQNMGIPSWLRYGVN
jgi:Ca2+-binding EF-hand superfamily protein